MITITTLLNRIQELASRKGLFAIGVSEFFTLVSDIVRKMESLISGTSISMIYQPDVANLSKLGAIREPARGWAARVLDQRDENGNAYIYQFDGKRWNRTPFVAFSKEVATQNDLKNIKKELVTQAEYIALKDSHYFLENGVTRGDVSIRARYGRTSIYATNGISIESENYLSNESRSKSESIRDSYGIAAYNYELNVRSYIMLTASNSISLIGASGKTINLRPDGIDILCADSGILNIRTSGDASMCVSTGATTSAVSVYVKDNLGMFKEISIADLKKILGI